MASREANKEWAEPMGSNPKTYLAKHSTKGTPASPQDKRTTDETVVPPDVSPSKSTIGTYKKSVSLKAKALAGFRSFPIRIDLESSNRCNLACIMCPHPHMERMKGNMDFDTFRRVIDEAKQYGLQTLRLHVLGEPLLNPNIHEFVRYAKQYDTLKNIVYSTNCTYLDERQARKILASGLDCIVLAVDGINKETYETIRIRADYEVVKRNVERFLTLRKQLRPDLKVRLSIINLKRSRSEVEAYRAYWRPFLLADQELIIKPFSNFGGQVDNRLEANEEGQKRRQYTLRHPCYLLWKNLIVLWNGDVTVCCLDSKAAYMKLGNVWEQSLQELWFSEMQSRYRKLHLKRDWKDMPLCQDCNNNTTMLKMPVWK